MVVYSNQSLPGSLTHGIRYSEEDAIEVFSGTISGSQAAYTSKTGISIVCCSRATGRIILRNGVVEVHLLVVKDFPNSYFLFDSAGWNALTVVPDAEVDIVISAGTALLTEAGTGGGASAEEIWDEYQNRVINDPTMGLRPAPILKGATRI